MTSSGVLRAGWRLNPASTVPPFEQVRLRIVDLVAAGKLPVGAKLPPVRTLAAEIGVAANTVARAYRELELGGVVATHGRAGTVIAAAGDQLLAEAAAAAADYAAVVHRQGIPLAKALALVRAAVERTQGS
ncbi:MAG: GntR family transcriptional regulator [Actinomycetota bacterium]|nr:GntR family transcriptional regulator [Actinomycetota bacterium]